MIDFIIGIEESIGGIKNIFTGDKVTTDKNIRGSFFIGGEESKGVKKYFPGL
ncbi:MAG: hypothetical protein ONB13_00180 [candidate division KSB1 bacterium]|nr:hypothetical protein [candidate division KSB1 bacterium]